MPDVYVGAKGETLVIRSGASKELLIPILILESIVVFGYKGVSPEAMELCVEHGASLVFLTPNGQFKARVTGETKGNVLLRKTQYRWSETENFRLRLAQRFVIAKMVNARISIMRSIRDHGDKLDRTAMESVCNALSNYVRNAEKCSKLDELRGIEGLGARQYFSVITEQVLVNKEFFYLKGRVKRPPTDRLNALLSFLYTLLAHDVTHALETVGLDPQIGFLHRDRPGRNSLALDLMEEFRVFMADRMALTLINRQQLGTEWQQRKREELRHPFIGEKISVGLLAYTQALLIARHKIPSLSAFLIRNSLRN